MSESTSPQPYRGAFPADLAALFGGRLVRNAGRPVLGFRPWESPSPDYAAFLVEKKVSSHLADVAKLETGLLVLPESLDLTSAGASSALSILLHPDPYLFFAQASSHLLSLRRQEEVNVTSIHSTAVVDPTATLGSRVRIGPLAVIGPNARIGDGTDIGAQCYVGEGVRLGEYCILHPRVTLEAGVQLGSRVVLQSGCVVGSDGFGYAPTASKAWVKIPQAGSVRIGDDVELGAQTVVDRGALGDTVIEEGVKIDNLVQIAHNVFIGAHTAIAGCVGIAGSARIGRHCQIGGAAGILGHLSIADGCIIGPMSLVTASLEIPQKYVGIMPIQEEHQWRRTAAALRHLPDLRRRIRASGL